jgi:hypothetical protein
MKPSPLDPTAGRRARQLQQNPDIAPPISDPTDPRCARRFRLVPFTARDRQPQPKAADPDDHGPSW